MRTKLILVGVGAIFGFGLIKDLYDKLTKRGRITAVFDHFTAPAETGSYPEEICYKYEVDGRNYFYVMKNAMKETENKGQKAKLMYNVKHPEKVAPDSGFVGPVILAMIFAFVCVLTVIFW